MDGAGDHVANSTADLATDPGTDLATDPTAAPTSELAGVPFEEPAGDIAAEPAQDAAADAAAVASDTQLPAESSDATSAESPAESIAESPAERPAESLGESPTETPGETNAESNAESNAELNAEPPAEALAESPAGSMSVDTTTADGPVSDAEEGEVSVGTRAIHSRNAEPPRFQAPFNDLRGTFAASDSATASSAPTAPAMAAPPTAPTAPFGPPRTAHTNSPGRSVPANSAASAFRSPPTGSRAIGGTAAPIPAADPAAVPRGARGLPAGNLTLISRVSYEADRPSATAELLVRHAVTPPEDVNWQLPGQAWPLYTVLERPGETGSDRIPRLAIVRAYWRLTAEVAAYNWSVEEGAFIAGLQALQPETETWALQAARIAAQARLQHARVAATPAQCELAALTGQGLREPLPLAGELPLVGPYQTRFEQLFANRAPPAGIRRIATAIPLRAELLQTLAAAVAADTDAIKEFATLHREGRVPLEPVLAAHERLQRHRGEFLESVRIYNEQIAEYALAIAGTSNNQTVVAMLVRNPTIVRAAQAPRMGGVTAGGVSSNSAAAAGYSAGYSASPGTNNATTNAATNSGFPSSGFPGGGAVNAGNPNTGANYPANTAPAAGSGYTPQGYTPQGYTPQGYTPQGYAPQGTRTATTPGAANSGFCGSSGSGFGSGGSTTGGTAAPSGTSSPRTSSRGAAWLAPAK